MNNTRTDFETKKEVIENNLKSLKKVAVAFSGGKDSFFLLKLAVDTLGKENVVALNVKSIFTTTNDDKRVDYFSKKLDFTMRQVTIVLANEKNVMANPKDRCYFCKTKIFNTLKQEAKNLGFDWVLDGTTFSDLDEYRPGLKAIEELNIISPLRDAGISSWEIVTFLNEKLGVEDYYVTSSTCLATRFPYGFNLDKKILETFDKVETYFVEKEIYPVKIRYIPDGVRIETPEKNFEKIMKNKSELLEFCKNKDLKFITLDLEGLKSGVWD